MFLGSLTNATLFIGFPVVLLLCFLGCSSARWLHNRRGEPRRSSPRGCSWPLDPAQVYLFLFVLLIEFTFVVVCLPALWWSCDSSVFYGVLGTHAGVASLAFSFWLHLSLKDPRAQASERSLGPTQYCEYCREFYSGIQRKHCHICGKCVLGYDHHCTFLNTCITPQNYLSFLGVSSTFFLVLFGQAVLGMYLLVSYADEAGHKFVRPYEGVVGQILWCVVLACTELSSALGTIVLGSLLGFHTYLNHTGQTTYQYLGCLYEEQKAAERLIKAGMSSMLSPALSSPEGGVASQNGILSRSGSPSQGFQAQPGLDSRGSLGSWAGWNGLALGAPALSCSPVGSPRGSDVGSDICQHITEPRMLTNSGTWERAIMFVSGMHPADARVEHESFPRVNSANDLAALLAASHPLDPARQNAERRTWPNLHEVVVKPTTEVTTDRENDGTSITNYVNLIHHLKRGEEE